MTKFFFKFEKLYFWPTFGNKNRFPKKSDIHNLIRFSSTVPKFTET